MVLIQYQAGRGDSEQPTIASVAGGATTVAADLWVGLQKRNRAGYNRISPLQQVLVAAGEQMQVTIPASARASGEGWIEFVIVAAPTNVLADARPIARLKATTVGGAPIPLPAAISFTTDDTLAIAPAVLDPASLPVTPLNGMLRAVTSTGFYYEYRADSTETVDGSLVLAATPGRWIQTSVVQTHILDLSVDGGTDADISIVTAPFIPTYEPDGTESEKVVYWITNDAPPQSGVLVPSGSPVRFQVSVDGALASNALQGNILFTFDGYVDIATGALDSGIENSGSSYVHQFSGNGFFLPADLEVGKAVQLSTSVQAYPWEADGRLINGSDIEVRPEIYRQVATFNPMARIFGDVILPVGDFRRLVPGIGLSLTGKSGASNINFSTTSELPPQLVIGLVAATDNQIISIDTQGTLLVQPTGVGLTSTQRKRAEVGTIAGHGASFDVTPPVLAPAPTGIQLAIAHPFANDLGTIRADYPDAIATSTGEFNPPMMRVFIARNSDSEERYFDFPVLPAATQDISITDWAAGTIGAYAAPNNTFSLFTPSSATASPVAGTLQADAYAIRVTYLYNGNQVTRISHDIGNGSIREVTEPFQGGSAVTSGAIIAPLATPLTLESPNVIAIDPDGQNRVVPVPDPVPGQYNFFRIYNDDPDYEIALTSGGQTAEILGGTTSTFTYTDLESIGSTWYTRPGGDSNA